MASSSYSKYCIPLNRSILVFFPTCPVQQSETLDTSKVVRTVVQVTIKQAKKDLVKELTTYFLAQFDITKAVESVLYAHILTSLPEKIRIEGDGYVLTGRRKPWEYGKNLHLAWGSENICQCPDKWTFIFDLDQDA